VELFSAERNYLRKSGSALDSLTPLGACKRSNSGIAWLTRRPQWPHKPSACRRWWRIFTVQYLATSPLYRHPRHRCGNCADPNFQRYDCSSELWRL